MVSAWPPGPVFGRLVLSVVKLGRAGKLKRWSLVEGNLVIGGTAHGRSKVVGPRLVLTGGWYKD
jgi:hypothetical protein